MANPKPTAAQVGYITAGAVAGAALTFGVLGLGGMFGGAIVGIGAALGAIPYQRSIKAAKDAEAAGGGSGGSSGSSSS